VSIAVNLVFEEDKSIAWIEGVAILSAVMISAIVGATNDYKKELKFQELNQVENKKKVIDLLRDGNKESLHVDNITVGDIVLIREGMEIAGDGILVEGDGIKVDESNMTGESDLLSKENLSRCLIAREAAWAENGSGDDISRHIPSMLLLSGTKVTTLLNPRYLVEKGNMLLSMWDRTLRLGRSCLLSLQKRKVINAKLN